MESLLAVEAARGSKISEFSPELSDLKSVKLEFRNQATDLTGTDSKVKL